MIFADGSFRPWAESAALHSFLAEEEELTAEVKQRLEANAKRLGGLRSHQCAANSARRSAAGRAFDAGVTHAHKRNGARSLRKPSLCLREVRARFGRYRPACPARKQKNLPRTGGVRNTSVMRAVSRYLLIGRTTGLPMIHRPPCFCLLHVNP